MSQKVVKRYKKNLRKEKEKIVKDFFERVQTCGFMERLKFAWMTIIKKQ